MRALIIAGLGLALVGCQSSNGTVSLTQSAQLVAAKGEYGFELAYSAAASAYNANLVTLAAHGSQAKAKALMVSLLDCTAVATGGKCTGYVQLARDAVASGSATDLATQTAAVQAVADQVAALISASKTGATS